MNLGKENEMLEFKKSTSEIKEAMDDIVSMLNKHCKGKLYFGVKPNGDICGQIVSISTLDDVARIIKEAIRPMIFPEIKEIYIDDKSLIEVKVCGKERPYSSFGRYYKRVVDRAEEMTPAELKMMMLDTDYSSLWENNLTEFTINDVDENALKSFYNRSVSCGRLEPLDKYDTRELLSQLGLLDNNFLTNAGYILFSNRKPIVLKMAVYSTEERIDFIDILRLQDNIYNLIDAGISYIKRHIDWKVELSADGVTRLEIPEIPLECIREIVVNSFAHANYRGETENEISITPSEISIYNPGEFPSNYSPEDYANKMIQSIPRNKKILDILFRSKSVEIQGSGLRKTYKLCKENDIKLEYIYLDYGFNFIFRRKNYTQKKIIKKQTIDQIVLDILKVHPEHTRNQIAKQINKSARTVQRCLDRLKEEKKILRIGSDKVGYWKVLN